MISNFSTTNANIIECRTKSVEKILEPLILQIKELVKSTDNTCFSKGLSTEDNNICQLLKQTINEFVDKGKKIAEEFPDMKNEFQIVTTDIKHAGGHFYTTLEKYFGQPANTELYKSVIRTAESLLPSVTRLLILADLGDVNKLQNGLIKLKEDILAIKSTENDLKLSTEISNLNFDMGKLSEFIKSRQEGFLDPDQKDEMALNQFNLQQGCSLLIATLKAHLQHPDLATLAANRSFAAKFACSAVERLSRSCEITYLPDSPPTFEGQQVLHLMHNLINIAHVECEKSSLKNGSILIKAMENLSSEIHVLTESAELMNAHQISIIHTLNALHEIVYKIVENLESQPLDDLRQLLTLMSYKCSTLRYIISKAALHLGSTAFISKSVSLKLLEDSASAADEHKLVQAAEQIQKQTTEIIDAALCLCSVTTDPSRIRFCRFTVMDLEDLTPQLINAAKVHALKNTSAVATRNFDVFLDIYKTFFEMLRVAIDDMTDVSDFIDVYNELLNMDIITCETEVNGKKRPFIMRAANILCARASKACDFVFSDIRLKGPNSNECKQIIEIINLIRNELIPHFMDVARETCRQIKAREEIDPLQTRQAGQSIIAELLSIGKKYFSLQQNYLDNTSASSSWTIDEAESKYGKTNDQTSIDSGFK